MARLALAVTFAFGFVVSSAFLASTKFTRTVVLEQGDTEWYKIRSVFSWGSGLARAYALQGAITLATAAALALLWRGSAAYPLKAAGLLIGSVWGRLAASTMT